MENISKFLENKKFIRRVFSPNEEIENWWKTYENSHPEERENIREAKKFLNRFETSDKLLTEEEKMQLCSKILNQLEKKRTSKRTSGSFIAFLKYAAVAVVFFLIGALLFYRQNDVNMRFYSEQFTEPVPGNEAKLIRPGGEEIFLEEQKTVIEHRTDGQVVVNNNLLKTSKNETGDVPDLNQLIIPYGKTSEIFLSDGSRVYLNAGSRLVYPEFFRGNHREVFLVGEAYFEVKPSKDQTFVVQTTDIRVKVPGTQFNISAYPSDNVIETVLTEGRVKVEQNNSGLFAESAELEPGQLAAYNKKSKETRLKTVDVDNYVLWKDGMLKFESTDFSRIVKKMERFYNIRFNYNDPLLGTIKISGKLELMENREEIINRLAIAAAVEILKKGENYYEINGN